MPHELCAVKRAVYITGDCVKVRLMCVQGSYKREVFKFENIQGFFMAVFENIFRANI